MNFKFSSSLRCLLSLSIFSIVSIGFAAPDMADVRNLLNQGKKTEAIAALKKINAASPTNSLPLMGLGFYNYQNGKLEDAEVYFNEALKLNSSLSDYANYFLGVIAKSRGDFEKARKHYSTALSQGASDRVEVDAAFEIAQIVTQHKNGIAGQKEAKKMWQKLERRLRGDTRYPVVLWSLMSLELNSANSWGACRYARKLYSQYPTHHLVSAWTLDLNKATVEDKRLGCVASREEQRKRIRNLQWGGQTDRALQEVQIIRDQLKKSDPFEADRVMAQYYIHEGTIDAALKLLLPHYKQNKNNYSYLMMVGQAASRIGDVALAVSSYESAYKLTPRSKDGRTALFQAGFVSYQFQDYDGATKRFREFLKLHSRSTQARDVKWHLAWMEYLRGDYEKSYQSLSALSKERMRRNPAGWSPERLKYWMAMNQYRSGKTQEARDQFFKLSRDPLRGYYAVAALERYKQIQKQFPRLGKVKKDVSPDEVILSSPTDDVAIADETSSEDETVEVTGEDGPVSPGAPDAQKTSVLAEVEEPVPTSFANRSFSQRFERGQALTQLGMLDWAKWELYAIEKRTSNREDLKKLMNEYEGIMAYNRSSSIGQIQFGMARARDGFKDGKKLWESTYPKAFETSIKKYASKFSVPEELVWGIMRAESQYRKDAMSAVGALGLMQIMPHTGIQLSKMIGESGFEPLTLLDHEPAIKLGAQYLARLMKRFDREIPLVAAAYNAGPHRVKGWLMSFGSLEMDEFIEHIPFSETRNYVKKVTSNYEIYHELYKGQEGKYLGLSAPITVKVVGPFPTRETWEEI